MGIFKTNISIINNFLNNFKNLFSKKQFAVFILAVYALLLEYKRNCLYSMANKTNINYQAFQYFFSESKWKLDDLNNTRLNIIQNQRTTASTPDGVLSIDDTSVPKPYAKNTEGAHYQHCTSLKREELCNVSVVSAFSSKSKYFPVNFKFYSPKKDFFLGKDDYKFKSKIQLAHDLLDDAISKNIRFSHVCFDSWYTANNFLQYIHSKYLNFIAEVKPNRLIHFYHPVKKRHCFLKQDELVKLIKSNYKHKLKPVNISFPNGYKKFFWAYSFKSTLKKLSIPIRVIILFGAFSHEDSRDVHILISNDLSSYTPSLVSKYILRWGIERIFKELKDTFAFDQYQLRHKIQIQRYWLLCFIAWSLVYWIKQNQYLNKSLSINLRSFNDYKSALASLLFVGSGIFISKNNLISSEIYGIKSARIKKSLGLAA